MAKQETTKAVRSFVLLPSEESKGAPQTETTTTSRPQGPPLVASDMLLVSCWHNSPKDARPSPPLSLEALCRRDGTFLCSGIRAGEEGLTQHLAISNSFMEHWQTLRRLAGPPFPPAGCLDASPPLSHC